MKQIMFSYIFSKRNIRPTFCALNLETCKESLKKISASLKDGSSSRFGLNAFFIDVLEFMIKWCSGTHLKLVVPLRTYLSNFIFNL